MVMTSHDCRFGQLAVHHVRCDQECDGCWTRSGDSQGGGGCADVFGRTLDGRVFATNVICLIADHTEFILLEESLSGVQTG